jgi:hypothetical protein
MGRPSKLTQEQWDRIGERLLAGETARGLGREFQVSEAAIRKRFGAHQAVSAQSAQVRTVAEKLAEAHAALEVLPLAQRAVAVSLAEKLRSISSSLASAAELGAKTSHRLQSLANSQVAKVDDADPMGSINVLRDVGVLTKLANDSASIALNLLAANKERIQRMDDSEREDATSDDDARREALARKLEAEDPSPAG